MTTNDFDALMLELISNSADEVDPYWVQNQAIAPGEEMVATEAEAAEEMTLTETDCLMMMKHLVLIK